MSLRSRSSVGFQEEGKTGESGEKPLGARERNNNKLNPYMASTLGFEPGLHWWGGGGLLPSLSHHPCPPNGILRRPADQQARRLWVRDWVEQRRRWLAGGGQFFFPFPFPDYRSAQFTRDFSFLPFSSSA